MLWLIYEGILQDDAGNIEGIIGGWIDVSDRVKLINELETF